MRICACAGITLPYVGLELDQPSPSATAGTFLGIQYFPHLAGMYMFIPQNSWRRLRPRYEDSDEVPVCNTPRVRRGAPIPVLSGTPGNILCNNILATCVYFIGDFGIRNKDRRGRGEQLAVTFKFWSWRDAAGDPCSTGLVSGLGRGHHLAEGGVPGLVHIQRRVR